ncbi:hypothetical protein ACE6H2_022799 [Prunus campanulata]
MGGLIVSSGSLTETLTSVGTICQKKKNRGDGQAMHEITEFCMQERKLALWMCVVFGWVEEASFIAAGSYHFSRNPNGFYSIWPSFFLPFSSHPFNHPILVKSTLPNPTKSGIFGSSMLFQQLPQWRTSIFTHPSSFFSPFFYGQV